VIFAEMEKRTDNHHSRNLQDRIEVLGARKKLNNALSQRKGHENQERDRKAKRREEPWRNTFISNDGEAKNQESEKGGQRQLSIRRGSLENLGGR